MQCVDGTTCSPSGYSDDMEVKSNDDGDGDDDDNDNDNDGEQDDNGGGSTMNPRSRTSKALIVAWAGVWVIRDLVHG